MFKTKIYRLLFLVIFVFSISCSNKKPASQTSSNIDLNALFDGKTLNGWEITNFGTQGPVDVEQGEIVLNYGDGCTGITWKGDLPTLNYTLQLEAKKTLGNDFFCGLTFPVDTQFCSLIVGGWGGPLVGISCIDGKDASENFTSSLINFEKNHWYKIRVSVNSEKITAFIDSSKVVDFNYTDHNLYVRPEVELSKPMGICTWNTSARLRNIVLTEK